MNDSEILGKSALEQGRLIRSGAISSEELTRLYLQRIDELDGEIQSFVQVIAEEAVRTARKADRATAPADAPFYGVPIAIKDLNAVRGTFMRMGSHAFPRLLTPADDLVVARLRRAGFILLGKTATSEVGALPVTEPDTHPPTRNPWDLEVTPGGSSGGAGAAIAASLAPIVQGSDGGGSVRIPASFCGVVGFKPSRGVVENPFGMEEPDIVWTCGPLARSVEDAAALLGAMAKAPATPLTFLEACRQKVAPLRIRMAIDVHIVKTTPEIRTAVERVATMLAELGHHIEPCPQLSGIEIDEFLPIWQELVGKVPVADWSLTQPLTRWLGEQGRKLDRSTVAARIALLADRTLSLFGDVDLWLTPTVAVPPPVIGSLRGMEPLDTFRKAAELGAFTGLFNITGQPAISLPAALSSAGHPIGIQLVGKRGEDAKVLAVARALEERIGWRNLVYA